MDTLKNSLLVILGAAVLGLGGLSWHQHTRLSVLRNPSFSSPSSPTVSPQAVSHSPGVVPRPVTGSRIPEATDAGPVAPVPGPVMNRRAEIAAIKERPEYKRLEQTVIRERLATEFAGLFYQLGLDSGEREDFLNLLLEKQLIGRDAIALARAEGLTFRQDEQAIRSLINDNMAEMDELIRDKFGEPAFEKYENYQATKSIRSLANSLDRKLSYSNSPIDTVQKERLIELIAQAPDQEVKNRGYGVLSELEMNMARGLLTPTQFEALEKLQEENLARARMREMVISGVRNASAP